MRIFAGVLLFLIGLFLLVVGVELTITLDVMDNLLGISIFICIGLVLEAFGIFAFYYLGTGKTASLHSLKKKSFYALVVIVPLNPKRMVVVLQDAKGEVLCVELLKDSLMVSERTSCVRVAMEGAKLVLKAHPEPSAETPQPPAEPEA